MVGACIQDDNDREGVIILDRYGPTWFIAHQPVFQPLHTVIPHAKGCTRSSKPVTEKAPR